MRRPCARACAGSPRAASCPTSAPAGWSLPSCIVPHGCTICGAEIRIGEREIEIVSRTGAVKIYLHRRCFDIWGEEASDEQARPGPAQAGAVRTALDIVLVLAALLAVYSMLP